MKISTKGRYALRLMIYIAANSNGKPVSIKDVAKTRISLINIWNRSFLY